MQYQGGKHRQAARLVARIMELSTHRKVIEPFCGGCSMTARFAANGFQVEASDAYEALVSTWEAAIAGMVFPTKTTLDDYNAAKGLPNSDPLRAYFEFGLSFGGKSWGGYAKTHARQNYTLCASRGIARKATDMCGRVTMQHREFQSIPIPEQACILYCDPPYATTTGYQPGAFNSEAFWVCCREWAVAGHDVFVSEYSAPSDVSVVLSIERTQRLRRSRGKGSQVDQVRTEHLYRVR